MINKFERIKLTHIFFNKLFISSIVLFKEISLCGSTDEMLILFTPKLLHITPISIIFSPHQSLMHSHVCMPTCIITREGQSL